MIYDNESLDARVGFIEDTHTYILKDNPKFKFTSVTTIIKDYHERFDAQATAEKVVAKKTSKYYGMDPDKVRQDWLDLGIKASAEGTALHLYGEYLLDGVPVVGPLELPKAKWVPDIIAEFYKNGYQLATTELLVYSELLQIAGQSDIILKKPIDDDKFDYMIYDWKFLGKPIAKKSFYNPRTRQYKKMTGPFKHLMDCNWIHYSIQLAIYQTLTGDAKAIKEKVLVVVYDDKYELVPCYPMRIFWDENQKLQAVYELWNGKFYDSRTDTMLKKWPADISGR